MPYDEGDPARANYRPAYHFKHFHDLRLVRPPEVPQFRPLEGDLGELGHRFCEYCFQVPANRIGSYEFSSAQLKTIQEVITLSVFSVFSVLYLGEKIKWNYAAGFGCIALAVFFVFYKWQALPCAAQSAKGSGRQITTSCRLAK
jgi:hypothetical protein